MFTFHALRLSFSLIDSLLIFKFQFRVIQRDIQSFIYEQMMMDVVDFKINF